SDARARSRSATPVAPPVVGQEQSPASTAPDGAVAGRGAEPGATPASRRDAVARQGPLLSPEWGKITTGGQGEARPRTAPAAPARKNDESEQGGSGAGRRLPFRW
ncbi:hypothetical protein ACFRCR_00985, partial [Oerskovia sp. NPDC056781]|uniref:hypothetical protein n=1 Tax=Oerskovia sp. NPDC056781 TaxID=3345942 RepID=UPI00367186A7